MNTNAAPRRELPKVKFRVLIAGRANAGKTSILQRVCDTTNSPDTYRVEVVNGKETRTKIHLDPTSERGQHDITDELVFSNHEGYVFHDTRGFESGSTNELQIIQEFVRDRSGRKRLQDRLHAIWYCIPMDNQRPSLDIEPFHNICPDKNVPVIAVFTKYEAFRSNTRLNLEDDEREYEDLEDQTHRECEKVFRAEYLSRLGKSPQFVCLEGMEKPDARCDDLIRSTMNALNPEAVTLMLLAVQTQNLELSVQYAVNETSEQLASGKTATKHIVKSCLGAFPSLLYPPDVDVFFDFVADAFNAFFNAHQAKPLLKSLSTFAKNITPSRSLKSFFKFDPRVDPPLVVTPLNSCTSQIVAKSRTFVVIVLVIVLRNGALEYKNSKISGDAALKQAYTRYSASDSRIKVGTWLVASPTYTPEEIIRFINSIPWDMS